jgi:hypothetical protein
MLNFILILVGGLLLIFGLGQVAKAFDPEVKDKVTKVVTGIVILVFAGLVLALLF